MKKQFRLKHTREFQSVMNKRKQFVTDSVILYYDKNDKYLRVGLSVSKKFGNAVIRNKIRRKSRAIIREMGIWDLKYDVVLIARKKFVNAPFIKQKKVLSQIFERLKNEK